MAQEQEIKKTGATPIVEDGIGGGELHGVVEVKQVLAKFRDGHGREMVRLAIVVPGGEVYFLDDRAMNTKPAQSWLKNAILKKMGLQ